MSALHIWMNGELVGTWRVGRAGNHRLDYAPSWRASARSRPLSLSLPFTSNNQLEEDAVKMGETSFVRNCCSGCLRPSTAMRRTSRCLCCRAVATV